MRVERSDTESLSKWRSFVENTPGSSPFHHAGWFYVLSECFAVEPYYLMAIDGLGKPAGVLPMYVSRSVFTGKHLSTMEGGALVNEESTAALLYNKAAVLRDRLRLNYLLVRGGPNTGQPVSQRLETVRTVIQVDHQPDELWLKLNKKTRWAVRQAEKNGLRVERDDEAVDLFYYIYAARMRELGTPVMGPCLMRGLRRYLADCFRLFVIRRKKEIIGGMLCLDFSALRISLYAATLSDFLSAHANYLLYWRVIEDSCLTSPRWFDLGRSAPQGGTHAFKRKWRGTDCEVPYSFLVAPGRKFSIPSSDERLGMSLRQKVWTHFPLTLANLLGPLLRRQLPFG
jgi:FemAB-related protein (PEP-CTERM system-associated)